jgi:hypothetical protein
VKVAAVEPAAFLGGGLWRRLPTAGKVVLGLAALLVVAQTTRAALFALHPDRPQHSVMPGSRFHRHHNCFTAYYEAARLVRTIPNVYEPSAYARPAGAPLPAWVDRGDARRTINEFSVDLYEYPPPFLLLPRAMIALGLDFLQARTLWFLFQTAAVLSGLLLVAWHLGADWGTRFVLLAPFIYLSPPVQLTLQMGNFQVAAIALALVAMVAIARGRAVMGAAVLSFVVLAKLFPGVLLLVLAVRRQWRPLLLTLGAIALWVGLALLILGPAPFEAFWRFQLPRIESGEAFPHLHNPAVMAVNQAVHGIPAKLALFGMGSGSARLASALAWIYTLVPCALALILGRRHSGPTLWALLLALGTYRSPFLPQEYAALGAVLVLCLVVARHPFDGRRVLVLVATFLLLIVQAPLGLFRGPVVPALINTVAQVVAAAVFVAAVRFLRAGHDDLRRSGRPLPVGTHAAPAPA